ncbi:SMI1/KNR4 family protein [Amycolatopsis sp. NPDC059657]|uniref:SMI1/KNR4 family protein n=1 Tax=Amycolatopsis sp. NPDC059657 TaxID=3346899 RepID=UPI00366FBF9F
MRDVLTASETQVDDRIGYAVLLAASAGAAADADRLVLAWARATERPVSLLAQGHVRARAFAMWFEARGFRPEWAEALVPLDLDAEEAAHDAYLKRAGESTLAKLVSMVETPRADPLKAAALTGSLEDWAAVASGRPLPDVATLLACRRFGPELAAGANPLGIDAPALVGDLIAALRHRYPPAADSWPELVAEIMRLRGEGLAPPPATVETLDATERRLRARLPDEYREFLLTCDGLPSDVIFPRLLPAAELWARDEVVVLSEPAVLTLARTGHVVEYDPELGTTVHAGFRALVEHHLSLLT